MFTVEFETDNAAFEDDGRSEIVRILKDIERQLNVRDDGLVRDINGNTIGQWHWT